MSNHSKKIFVEKIANNHTGNFFFFWKNSRLKVRFKNTNNLSLLLFVLMPCWGFFPALFKMFGDRTCLFSNLWYAKSNENEFIEGIKSS